MDNRPPPALEAGETLQRVYTSDQPRVRATARSVSFRVNLLTAGGIAGLVCGFLLAFLIPPLGGATVLVGLALVFVSRVALGGLIGLNAARLPDVVYLTDRRVIVDQGRAWSSVVATPRAAVREVVLWSTPTMRTAGLSWAYLMPLGATRVEVREMGELTTAPGVVEIQNLSTPDAQELRARLSGAAPSFQLPGPSVG